MSEAEIGILAAKFEALEKLMVEKFLRVEEKLDLITGGLQSEIDTHVAQTGPWQTATDKRLDNLERGPGMRATATMKWFLSVIGVIIVTGIIGLTVLGVIHTLESTPNIGNHIDLPQDQNKGAK